MKNFKTHLSAILILLAAPALLISCREDAPEINYTVNVSMASDFSSVLDDLNAGILRQAEALEKLVAAIDRMNGDQAAKLQALIDALASAQNTLETKLALIEAAIQAQTLSLAEKLSLIETAVNALPDYSGKFDAIVSAINNLIAEVNAGHTSADEAWAEIIAQLEALKEAVSGLGGETFTNTVTLDGVTMPVLGAYIDQSDFEGDNYDIYLYLSDDRKVRVNLMANREYHDGKTTDLTRDDESHPAGVWYWSIMAWNSDHRIINGYGQPSTGEVFQSGTLHISNTSPAPEFEITLQNGRVTDGNGSVDGLEHTISVDFKGVLLFDEF